MKENIDDIIWLKSEESRLYHELKDAERDNPNSITSANLRWEYENVLDSIDYFECITKTI